MDKFAGNATNALYYYMPEEFRSVIPVMPEELPHDEENIR